MEALIWMIIIVIIVIMALLGWIVASIAYLKSEAKTNTFFLRYLVRYEESKEDKEINRLKEELKKLKEEKEAGEYDDFDEIGGDDKYDYE